MNELLGLAAALGTKGHAGAKHVDRTILKAVEHKEIDLPTDIINGDGSLDLYDNVQSYFEVQYKRKTRRFVLRNNGWIGHIPLNDRYMLEIDARVPIQNLEKIIERAPIGNLTLFSDHTHTYLAVEDRPRSLFDVLADRFLFALDEVRSGGLLKEYVRLTKSGSAPAGRLDAFRSAVRTNASGMPLAVYSSFERTIDIAPNRLLRAAIERMIMFYITPDGSNSDARLSRLSEAFRHFEDVRPATSREITAEAIARYARFLPEHRTAYFDALRFAGYILAEQGMAIRGSGGLVIAPAAVIDFATIFESYARGILAQKYDGGDIEVLDGNIGGSGGAKDSLFTELFVGTKNADVKPDIVLRSGNENKLIIDVKYKPPQPLPDRADTEQLMCYAARYGCEKVMVLYPSFPQGYDVPVERVGNIGSVQVYRGVLNLGAENLDLTETVLANSVLASLAD